jgi:hypothetical protein
MKKILVFLGLLVCAQLAAQKSIVNYFPVAATTGGTANLQELAKGYLSPLSKDFGSLINNGWYNTAATHKRFGFDLTVAYSMVSAKSNEKYFTVPNLTGVQFDGTSALKDNAPTAYGSHKELPNFHYTSGLNNGRSFQGPGGNNNDLSIGALSIPTIQAGIGLFANTDLRIRYTPEIKINDNKLSNWGVGIHHDIKQHIPGLKSLPFSLSVFVAYSQLKAIADLSGVYAASGTKQEGVGDTKAYTAQVLISKKLAIVTLYGGLGYNGSKTDYSIKGTYIVDHAVYNGNNVALLGAPYTLTNPFGSQTKLSGVRATAGLRLNLGPVILNGDYSYVNSKGLITAGFGFTVR